MDQPVSQSAQRTVLATARDHVLRNVDAALAVIKALVRLGYFSLEVEGAEHLPRQGPVIYAQNHAGWFALDGFFLGVAVKDALGLHKVPSFAVHDSVMGAPLLGKFFRSLGGIPASWLRHPERLPPEIEAYGIFPEGVRGNCKPFWEAYRMRDWSRGFVRTAIARRATIVPVAILGGEESLPVTWTVKALEPLVGATVGLPLFPLPLPARWKVIFHEPVRVTGHAREGLTDVTFCSALAAQVQSTVQKTLDRETSGRPLARLSSFIAEWRRRSAESGSAEHPAPFHSRFHPRLRPVKLASGPG